MSICRACLCYDNICTPIDEDFIANYNKLTDLEIHKEDGISLFFCSTCVQVVKSFMIFRERCRQSEAAIKLKISGNKEEISSIDEQQEENQIDETQIFDDKVLVKLEVKLEPDDSEEEHVDTEREIGEWWPPVPVFNEFGLEDLKSEEKEETQTHREFKPTNVKGTQNKNKTKGQYRSRTNNVIALECGLCKVTSSNIRDLNTHLETHRTSEGCENCDLKFADWPGLLAHRLMHLPDNAIKKCHLCFKMYKTPSSLEYHYLTMHHSGEDKRVRCVTCWRAFDTPKKLRKHEKASHGNQKYQCNMCQKWFKTKSNIRRHVDSHAAKHYTCDKCDFRSNQKTVLRAHKIAKHTTEREYCPNCRQLFADSHVLTRHLTKCKRIIQVCKVCGKEMDNPHSFYRHMRTHEPEARYRCDREDCTAVFRTSKAFRVHKDRHENNPRWQCPHCSKRFFSETVLIKHRRTHTGEKPYSCSECGKQFAANYSLKLHMKTHGIDLIVKKNQTPAEDLNELVYISCKSKTEDKNTSVYNPDSKEEVNEILHSATSN